MVQRSVEFVSSPPRDSIVMLPSHMDKSKSQPQHPISAELTFDREKPAFSSLWLGGRPRIFPQQATCRLLSSIAYE